MKRRNYLASLCFILSIFIAVLTIVLMFLGWSEQVWQTGFAVFALACSYLGAFIVKDMEYAKSYVFIGISAILTITVVVLLSWYYSFKSSSLLVVTILCAMFALNRSVYNVYKTHKNNKGQRENPRT